MARSTVSVTTSWQLVASTKAVFLTTRVPDKGGCLMFNEAASDDDALCLHYIKAQEQVFQNENKETYVRATGDGWVLQVDEAG